MKKRFGFLGCFIFLAAVLVFSCAAADNTVFLDASGKTAGSVTTLNAAYEALGDEGGTVVLCANYPVTASFLAPAHTGKIKITAVYGGVDYRKTNSAAFSVGGSWVFRFMGETELDGITLTVAASKTATLAADFFPLTLGSDVITNGAGSIRITGGPYSQKTVGALAADKTSSITVMSGAITNILAFSYDIANMNHLGKMYITLGGTATVGGLWFGVTNSTTSYGGAVELTMQDSASVGTLYMAGNKANMFQNGDAVVNIGGNAAIGAFKYYDKATLYPDHTRTLNIQNGGVSLPDGYADCFDTVIGSPDVQNADVAFVRDGGTGKGLTPQSPANSLAKAYALLGEDGGTVVICGRLSVGAYYTAPAHTGTVTYTSVYDGVDWRTSGAELYFKSYQLLTMGGETVFRDMTFTMDVSCGIAASYHPITFDTGLVMNADYASRDANGLYLVGGDATGKEDPNRIYDEDPSITVRSGTVSRLVGFSRNAGKRHHTGTAYIKVQGDAVVRYLLTGAGYMDADAYGAVVDLEDRCIIEKLYIGGTQLDINVMNGPVVINVDKMDGGRVTEINQTALYNNKGGITLTYSKATEPDGLLYLARLAKFDTIQTTCGRDGSHEYSAPYTNPFDPASTLRRCAACGEIEFLGEVPEKVAENVLFVADGGFGDGRSPRFPLGDFGAAMDALAGTGGSVVLCGPCTLQTNYSYKFGSLPAFYQEPKHTDPITVTSVYGGADYRESAGAKLIFNGNMDYKLYGPTAFDGLVFDATADSVGNVIAARYEKLVIGSDVRMERTVADGYKLDVVGGYRSFTYIDYVGVEIEDEYLRFSSHAVGVDTFDLPDTKVFPILDKNGKEMYPRAATTDAFTAMYAAMEAAGLKLPFVSSSMQSYEHKYDYITGFFGRTWRAHPDWDWERVFIYVTKSTGLPGFSEHHLGLAVDMYDKDLTDANGVKYESPNQHYDETAEWQWIREHGKEYGIILRYPTGSQNYTGFVKEMWHFRYVGVEHAYKIMEESELHLLEFYVAKEIGLFDKDSDVTVLSGSYNAIDGGSVNCDHPDIVLTGGSRVYAAPAVKAQSIIGNTYGDVNGDSVCNLLDVIRLLRMAAEPGSETTVADALYILKYILNEG